MVTKVEKTCSKEDIKFEKYLKGPFLSVNYHWKLKMAPMSPILTHNTKQYLPSISEPQAILIFPHTNVVDDLIN